MLVTQPQAQRENAWNLEEWSEDQRRRFESWRVLHPSILTEAEVVKMQKMHKVYTMEIGGSVPAQLELVEKEEKFLWIKYKYKEAKLGVQDSDFEVKTWISRMGNANGAFRFQSEEIIKICCQFQKIKKERHLSAGFMTDPENLFCEEIKSWATNQFCNLEATENNKEIIIKRIRYLEELLCEDNLFDRPDSRVTHTIQQVLVAVRGVLKYHTIPVIDKKLVHADAGAAFEEFMKHIIIIISDTSDFLYHVLRGTSAKPNTVETDKAARLLKSVLRSPDICNAMMLQRNEIILGSGSGIEEKPIPKLLDMGKNGKLFLHEDYAANPEERTGQNQLIELTQGVLQSVFVDDDCGLEKKFRSNAQVAKHYLKAHAYLLSFGNLYGVLEKAKDCALTGGTLLVYGIANAQLNSLLELSDNLINALNSTLNVLTCIAETRFGELVYSNSATVTRCPWIVHFKQLPSLQVKIEKRIKQLLNEIGKMRAQANSITLYEHFQKAQKETDLFLSAADGFTKHMAKALGVAYEKPVSRGVVNVPTLQSMQDALKEEVCEAEVPSGNSVLSVSFRKPHRVTARRNLLAATTDDIPEVSDDEDDRVKIPAVALATVPARRPQTGLTLPVALTGNTPGGPSPKGSPKSSPRNGPPKEGRYIASTSAAAADSNKLSTHPRPAKPTPHAPTSGDKHLYEHNFKGWGGSAGSGGGSSGSVPTVPVTGNSSNVSTGNTGGGGGGWTKAKRSQVDDDDD